MKVNIFTPTKAYLDASVEEIYALKKQLTYEKSSVKFLIAKHYKNFIWKSRNRLSWDNRLAELQKDVKRTVVYEEEDGRVYIRPGSLPYLHGFDISVENHIKYPQLKKIPWAKPLPFDLKDYQEDTSANLIIEKHGNGSLATGTGKSAIILKTCREMGVSTVVVVPSRSIFNELLKTFELHFGKKFVGTFGDGKKKLGKKITIAIGDSLANIESGSSEDLFFSKLDCLIVDESHEFAAESLEKVCHGVLKDIPYRFFLSATQVRNDGTLPLLQSIIGKNVYTLPIREAIEKKYISPVQFRIVEVRSDSHEDCKNDPLTIKREHFLKNKEIANFCAKLGNAMAAGQGKRTLVLVQELSQLAMIVPLLKTPFAIAHSEKNAAKLKELGLHKVDNDESVEKFNKNEAMILIGTGCIATGKNIFTHFVCNWVGGASEIVTKQGAIGRGARRHEHNPWKELTVYKDECVVFDFDVVEQPVLNRHLGQRVETYGECGDDLIQYIKLKNS